MAREEGVLRIVKTGKLIVLIGIVLGVLSAVAVTVSVRAYRYLGAVFGIAFRVAALGGLVWGAGWIAQGFTRPDP
jgi:hypothetical protein